MQRVCIIGAGAGGLCVGRHLKSHPHHFTFDIYERSADVGGTWVYTDETGNDKYGQPIHSSMYKHLHTNLPKEVMAFPEFPFDTRLPSFMHHTDVRKYLESYASHYRVMDSIKFLHCVERVQPLDDTPPGPHWQVTVRCVDTGRENTQLYDAVFVCTGHYSVPHMPGADTIPGLSTFPGATLHSHEYRSVSDRPDLFTPHTTVLCLGAGSSGVDIAIELSKHVKQVYLSHCRPSPLQSVLPANVTQVCAAIDNMRGNTVTFAAPGSTGTQVTTQLPCSTGTQAATQLPGDTQVTTQLPGSTQVTTQLPGSTQVTTQLPGSTQVATQLSGSTQVATQLPGSTQVATQFPQAAGEVDVLLLCTGYRYVYPFLSPECGVSVSGGRVTPLYKHLVNIRHPTMFLIGVPLVICPFPMFDVQARFCVRALLTSVSSPDNLLSSRDNDVSSQDNQLSSQDNDVSSQDKQLSSPYSLPSTEEMLKDETRDYKWRTEELELPHRHAHKMGTLQWSYNADLCSLAALRPLDPVIQKLYDHVHAARSRDLTTYKGRHYRITSPDTFQQI